ncbi:APC family permease [Parasphingorhabdus pacifica]
MAVGFGSMIGFGWVVLAGQYIDDAGVLGSALAFVIGGLIVALVGLTYAELVSAMPKAGGEHHYVLRALGSRWAFVASWAVVVGYVSVVAFEAVALPETIAYLVPQLSTGVIWHVAGSPVYAIWTMVAVAGAAVITILNYVGVRPATTLQSIGVLFLLGVGACLLFGSLGSGSIANADPLFTGGTMGIMGVVVATPFLFLGFDVIPQSAEETQLPSRQVGKLLVLSVVLATSWYVLIQIAVGTAIPLHEIQSSDLATATAMAALWNSDTMGGLLIVGGVAGILTSWNGLLIGSSRLVYAMGKSKMLPAWFAKIHPKYRTPSNAILFIGGISMIAPLFGEQMLTWLSNAGAVNIVVGYLLVSVSFLVLRRREPELERPFRVRRPWGIGVAAILLSAMLILLALPGMPAALSWPYEWMITILFWGIGAVFFLSVPRIPPGPGADEQLRSARA